MVRYDCVTVRVLKISTPGQDSDDISMMGILLFLDGVICFGDFYARFLLFSDAAYYAN